MHLRGAVSGRCATIPENRRAPYREVVRGNRCRLAGVDASMGQRLLDLLSSLQTLATAASIWIEIVALQLKTDLAANGGEALARWFCDAYPRDCSKPDAENTYNAAAEARSGRRRCGGTPAGPNSPTPQLARAGLRIGLPLRCHFYDVNPPCGDESLLCKQWALAGRTQEPHAAI